MRTVTLVFLIAFAASCCSENDSKQQVVTFLTFQKNEAGQAMNFYVSLFENSGSLKSKGGEMKAQERKGPLCRGYLN